MLLFDFAGNRADRTLACASGTTLTCVSDRISYERLTGGCRTLVVVNMVFVFVPEVFDRRKNRVWSCLSKTAERAVLDLACQFFQQFDIAVSAFASGDPFEDFQHSLGADPAVVTLTAGFVAGEVQEVSRHVNHTGIFVHNDHTAGAYNRAGLVDIFVCNRRVDQACRNTAAGWSAHLHRFELSVGLAAAACAKQYLF